MSTFKRDSSILHTEPCSEEPQADKPHWPYLTVLVGLLTLITPIGFDLLHCGPVLFLSLHFGWVCGAIYVTLDFFLQAHCDKSLQLIVQLADSRLHFSTFFQKSTKPITKCREEIVWLFILSSLIILSYMHDDRFLRQSRDWGDTAILRWRPCLALQDHSDATTPCSEAAMKCCRKPTRVHGKTTFL